MAESRGDGQVWVRGHSSSEEVPLAAAVAELFIEERLTENDLAMSVRGGGREPTEADVRDVAQKLRQQAAAPGRGVLLDTSTAASVFGCLVGIGDPYPGPFNVLDLSTLTFACLFYDKVFFLPSSFGWHLAEHVLPGICELLDVPGLAADATALGYLDEQAGDFLTADNWRREFESDWEIFLHGSPQRSDDPSRSVRLDSDKLSAWRTGFDPLWDNVSVSDAMSGRLDLGYLPERPGQADPFLTMATLRPLRSSAVAAALDIPYIASPLFSVPWRRISPMQGTQARAIDVLLGRLTPQPNPLITQLPQLLSCAAPLPLGLVLVDMRTPDDYATAVLRWRERFAPLRARLHKDLITDHKSEAEVARRYADQLAVLTSGRSVSTAVPVVQSALGSAAASAPVLFSGAPAIAVCGAAVAGSLAGLAAIPALTGRLGSLAARANRRHLLPLVALRDHAASLLDLADEVKRVWGHTWQRGYVPPGGGVGRLDELKLIDHLVRQPLPPPFLTTPF